MQLFTGLCFEPATLERHGLPNIPVPTAQWDSAWLDNGELPLIVPHVPKVLDR